MHLRVLRALCNDLTGNPYHGANDCGYMYHYYEWGDSECNYDGEPYICEEIGELESWFSAGLFKKASLRTELFCILCDFCLKTCQNLLFVSTIR